MSNETLRNDLKIAMTKDYKTLKRCLLIIYEMQTEEEKSIEITIFNNNIGFTGADAHRLSYYARWIKDGKELNDLYLDDCRTRMMKYSGQLLKIINVVTK